LPANSARTDEPRCKSAQLRFVVAVETGTLLLDVGQNRHTRARGQCLRGQHLIDRAGGKARCLVVRFENRPDPMLK
jgi:hypothetical protein